MLRIHSFGMSITLSQPITTRKRTSIDQDIITLSLPSNFHHIFMNRCFGNPFLVYYNCTWHNFCQDYNTQALTWFGYLLISYVTKQTIFKPLRCCSCEFDFWSQACHAFTFS